MYYLNQFYDGSVDVYATVSNDIFDRLKMNTSSSLPIDYNILLFGKDVALLKYLTLTLVRWQMGIESELKIRTEAFQIGDIEITYSYSKHHIEINFDQTLSKEKMGCLEFLKSISSQKTVSDKKRIVTLVNIHKAPVYIQNSLRSLIEQSQDVNNYICYSTNLSKVTCQLRSCFANYRIPVLTLPQRLNLFTCALKNTSQSTKKWPNDMNLLKYIEQLDICYFDDLILSALSVSASAIASSAVKGNKDMDKNKDSNKDKDNHNDTLFEDDIERYFFLKNEILSLLNHVFYKKQKKTVSVILETIRTHLYRIIHYNISHEVVCTVLLDCLMNRKNTSQHVHELVYTVSKLEYDLKRVHICKTIHVYEEAFVTIFCILQNVVG